MRILPAGIGAEVESIVAWQGTRESATSGDSVTLTLAPDVDVSRGDVIVAAEEPLDVADQFQARLLWMGDEPLAVGRPYRLKLHTCEVGATVTRIRHRVEVSDGSELAAAQLELNDLGVVNLATNRPIPFAPFDESRKLGGFILIDRATNATLGAGTITYSLMRAANVTWQDFDITGESSRRSETPARALPLADRSLRLRQIDHRQPA